MKYKNYKYLGRGAHLWEVPTGWLPIAEKMLSDIDKTVRPWYIPRPVMNLLYGKKGLKKIEIEQIKEKFGGLRVYYYTITTSKSDLFSKISPIVNAAIKEVDGTCQECGSKKDVEHSVSGYKGRWIKNLCIDCRVKDGYKTTASAKKFREEAQLRQQTQAVSTKKKEAKVPELNIKVETKTVETEVVKVKAKVKKPKKVKNSDVNP